MTTKFMPAKLSGEKNSQKSLVVQKIVQEEDAFVRAQLENLKIDARKELDRRKMAEFRRNLAERIRSYSSHTQLDETESRSRISAARKVYGSIERSGLRRTTNAESDGGCRGGSNLGSKLVNGKKRKANLAAQPEMKSLKELIKQNEKRLDEIPSICQCRPAWKSGVTNFEMCANNCTFYKNQKDYVNILKGLLETRD